MEHPPKKRKCGCMVIQQRSLMEFCASGGLAGGAAWSLASPHALHRTGCCCNPQQASARNRCGLAQAAWSRLADNNLRITCTGLVRIGAAVSVSVSGLQRGMAAVASFSRPAHTVPMSSPLRLQSLLDDAWMMSRTAADLARCGMEKC
eukprot:3938173-Rhodomonas_salina.3